MSSSTANMPRLKASQIRAMYIDYFASKQAHTFVPSSPCVPYEDPTLLFTNAGMNQFKPLFLGQVDPTSPLAKLKRAVNSQKCIRAGGKHNDLDDVGKDTYHHTFFEMLGNWSFGDYFKKDAIRWSFELLTQVYGIRKEAIYATYFGGHKPAGLEPDEETRKLWLEYLPASRVLPGNMKDNFWEMGDTGPCGPCTEIHVCRESAAGNIKDSAKQVNGGDPDVIEIWNNVFIQFNREADGSLKPLPAKHVDTGMGFERLTSILNNVKSNYDTDVFAPLFVAIERSTGARAYAGRLGTSDIGNIDTAYRVIADHIRTLTFAITDGATPSNEGRGYVLRRILRRAVRYGRQCLGAKTGFFANLVPVLVDQMHDAFPELAKAPNRVQEIIREEEESFARTIDRGIVLFDEACVRAFTAARLAPHHQMDNMVVTSSKDEGGHTLAIHKKDGHELAASVRINQLTQAWADAHFGPSRVLKADDAFKLYDTYGFPFDLTKLMAEERGLAVDESGFHTLMEEAKERARAGGKFSSDQGNLALSGEAIARLKHMNVQGTDDSTKFSSREITARVVAIWNGRDFEDHLNSSSTASSPAAVILSETNFYSEMGGQVGDHGTLRVTTASSGRESGGELDVIDTKAFGGYVIHIGKVSRRDLKVGDTVVCTVDRERRREVESNHTATHLMNLALRDVLGAGVDQKGSMVAPDKLRFDFSFNRPVAPEELSKVEHIVSEAISANLPVHTEATDLAKAKAIAGVRAVFGETYPDPVRVVSVSRKVTDLFDEKGALSTSAEFCGGTHVTATGSITAFAILSEEGVAKGVRRLTAVSGMAAKAGMIAGEQLMRRVQAASRLDGENLTTEVKAILTDMEALTVPLRIKLTARQAVSDLQEKIKQASKAAAGARASEVASEARGIASSSEWEMAPSIITTIDAGSDKDALAAAINTIREIRPKHAILLVSPDRDEGKLTIVASVPEALQKRGLKAGDWVKEAAAACGGRGGGRPDMAQGGGTDVTKIKETLAAARSFAFAKVPSM